MRMKHTVESTDGDIAAVRFDPETNDLVICGSYHSANFYWSLFTDGFNCEGDTIQVERAAAGKSRQASKATYSQYNEGLIRLRERGLVVTAVSSFGHLVW